MQHTDFSNSAASAYLVDVLDDESIYIKRRVYSRMQYFNEVMKELRKIESKKIHTTLVLAQQIPHVTNAPEIVNSLLDNISAARRREEIRIKE